MRSSQRGGILHKRGIGINTNIWRKLLTSSACRGGAQLSPTTSDGAKTTVRGFDVSLPLMRSTSNRTASLVISATGCSVLVKRGLTPPRPAIVSVDAMDTSCGQRRPRSAKARITPSAITPFAT